MPESPRGRVIIVDDDAAMRRLARDVLEPEGHDVDEAPDGARALAMIRERAYEVVVSDLRMPGLDGMALLDAARRLEDPPHLVLITAYGSVPQAVAAMRAGAFDFLEKPLPSPATLRRTVARALEARTAARARSAPPDPAADDAAIARMMVAGPAMAEALAVIRAVARRDTTVLVTGESGTGKELAALAIHALSRRAAGPFVAVNCAAIPEGLVESQLFGHERGAFTGASSAHAGFFERASGGTAFLDEVGDLPPAVQAKLLRVLQERTVVRLGGARAVDVDFRLVAAANRDLESLVRQGRFREDLFYRLAVVPVALPPLRQRPDDIGPLVERFIREMEPGNPPAVAPETLAKLRSHGWPGNVRELRNVIERALVLRRGDALGADDIRLTGAPDGGAAGDRRAESTLREMERKAILDALAAAGGNRRKAAERLGISLRTLQYRLKEYGTGTGG